MMNDPVQLMRVYISSTDKVNHMPLYEAVVFEAKKDGLQGATVLRGAMGFGGSSAIASASMWELTEKLPVVVEIVDSATRLRSFGERLKALLNESGKGCLVTLQDVEVLHFGLGRK